jgi:hypothetical protein
MPIVRMLALGSTICLLAISNSWGQASPGAAVLERDARQAMNNGQCEAAGAKIGALVRLRNTRTVGPLENGSLDEAIASLVMQHRTCMARQAAHERGTTMSPPGPNGAPRQASAPPPQPAVPAPAAPRAPLRLRLDL